jgi:hypothetical protein
MGLPPNHPKLDHFSIETHGFGGNPIVGTPPVFLKRISEKKEKTHEKDPSKTLLPRL